MNVKSDRRLFEKENHQLMEAYQDTISILKNENRSLHEQLKFMLGKVWGCEEIANKLIPHHKAGSYQDSIEVEC